MRGLVVVALASVSGAYVAPPRAARRLRPPRSDGGGDDGDEPPAALPIDFGSGGAAWTFEWPAAPAAEPWDGRDVVAGATAYAACHVLATLAAAAALGAAPSGVGAADAAVRAAGAGAFLLAQDRAGAWPLVPLRRGLPAAAVADALDGGRTVAVARVSDATPWPAVAVGASVPVFQAVLVPLALSAPPGALAFDAARLPPPPELFDGLVAAPLCETLVFQCWLLEACRRAGFAYVPSVLGAAACFGAWHGAAPTSAFLALLGAYWGHLYAQTRSALVPATMHALWNALALGVAASLAPPS